jgi:hypothetical protein
VSQPKSFEQSFQECCDELRPLQPSGSQGGAAVSRFDVAAWLQNLPLPGVVCSLCGSFCGALIARYMYWKPHADRLAKLQAALDKGLADMKANRAPEPSPELLKVIADFKSLLEQLLTELRGKVSPDELNGPRDATFAQAVRNGARDHEADEAAHLIADKFGKSLSAPPNAGTPPGAQPPGPPRT